MVETKICFNCYEEVGIDDAQCEKCGVEIYSKNSPQEEYFDHYKKGLVRDPDYEKELAKLDDLKKKDDNLYSGKTLEDDLKIITLLISVLGLLQIYTGGLIDSINATSTFLEIDTTIEGKYLVYSGFLYFAGTFLFYINYKIARMIYLLANLTHVYLLYRSYKALFLVYDLFSFIGRSNLPPNMQNFMDDIGLFRIFIVLFGIFYVGHSIFLFRFEVTKYLARGDQYN